MQGFIWKFSSGFRLETPSLISLYILVVTLLELIQSNLQDLWNHKFFSKFIWVYLQWFIINSTIQQILQQFLYFLFFIYYYFLIFLFLFIQEFLQLFLLVSEFYSKSIPRSNSWSNSRKNSCKYHRRNC